MRTAQPLLVTFIALLVGTAPVRSQTTNCLTTPAGLTAWWPAEGHALDAIESIPGTIVGNVHYAAGKVEQAFQFDGTNSAIFIPRSAATDIGAAGSFTIAAWLQPTSERLTMWIGWSDDENSYGLYGYVSGWTHNSIYFNLVDTTSASHVIASPSETVVPGQMQHITLTYDRPSGEAVIYRNAQPVARENLGSFTADTAKRIVLGRQPPSWAYDGLLDELMLFECALSSNEVAAIVAAGSYGLCQPRCVAAPTNPVAWWTGDGHFLDVIGSHNGTPINGTGFAAGKVGQGFRIQDSPVRAAGPFTFATRNAFTFATWFRVDSVPSAGDFYGLLSEEGPCTYRLLLGNAGLIYNPGTHTDLSVGPALSPGRFYHLAMTITGGGTAKIYLNGQLIHESASGVPAVLPDVGTFLLGSGEGTGTWTMNDGMMDEPVLYDRVLSGGEIASIHAAGNAGMCKPSCVSAPANPVGWWPGDGHLFDLAGTNFGNAGPGVSYVPGRVGTALQFVNSPDSYVEFPNSPEFQPTNNQLTIMAWVKPDFSPSTGIIDTVLKKRDGCSSPYSYALCITKGVAGYPYGAFGLGMQPQLDFAYSTNRIPDDSQFHHIAATYNGSKSNGNCVLYLDGQIVKVADGPGPIPITITGPVMGKHAECGYYSTTAIDELMFYGRELSAGEIQTIVAAGSAGACKPPVVLGELQPLNQTRAVGGRANFSLLTAGPASFQWRRNGTPLATTSTNSVVLTNLQSTQAGNYDVLVQGATSLIVTSRTVRLNVISRDVSHTCLAAWWPGEGNADDALGFYDGSLRGAAGFTNGIIGSAFHPNGGYVDLGVGPALDSFTVAAWVWVDPALNTGEQRVVSHDNYTLAGERKAFMIKSSSLNAGRDGAPWFEVGAPNWQGLSAPGPLTAGWHHLAGVRNLAAGQLELYVDGVLVAHTALTATETIDSSVPTVLSGVSPSVQIEPFHGRIDEVAIFSCALSAQEIGALLAPAAAPDLTVENVTVPDHAEFGGNIVVTWTVRNRGTAAGSVARTDRLWFSTGTTPDAARVLLDVQTTNAAPLAIGDTNTLSAMVTLPLDHSLAPGSFHIGVTVDAHGQVRETSEDNNAAASATITLVLPPLPDLSITQVSAPAINTASQLASIVWTITNRGPAVATGPWVDSLYLADDANGTAAQLLAEVTYSGSLAPATLLTRTQQVILPARVYGNRVVIVRSDARDQVYEYDDTNNERASVTVTLLPPPLPDLTVADILAPASALPGQALSVSWAVTNQGNAAASAPWTETLYLAPVLDPNAALAVGSFSFSNTLPAAASMTRTQTVILPSLTAGSWRLGVWVDSAGQLPDELTQTNNLVFTTNLTQVQTGLVLQLSATEIAEAAPDPAILVTVLRNGAETSPLFVNITNSDPTELLAPTNVVIAAGQTAAQFEVNVVNDGLIDGLQRVALAVSAGGYGGASAQILVHDTDVPRLAVVLNDTFLTEGSSTNAFVVRNDVTPDSILVRLRSSASRQLLVPDTVTIPANQTAVAFELLALDDGLVEATQPYTVTASATAYEPGSAVVSVADNDWPTVRVEITPTALSESAGMVMVTVTRSVARPQGVVLDLESGNPNVLWVPDRIGIQPGQTFASFPILPVDNALVDGVRPVEVRAFVVDSVTGERLAPATPDLVEITDNDGPTLALSVARTVVAEGLSAANTGTVSRNTVTNDSPLVVQLTSADPTEATVPATITIPAGESSVSFAIDTIQDGVPDGSQSVAVRANAAGFNGSSTTFIVSDRDLPDLVISGTTLPASGVTSGAFGCAFRLANRGLSTATGPTKQHLFLSSDPAFSGDDRLLGEFTFNGTLPVGQEVSESQSFTLPAVPGDYWLIVAADTLNAVAETSEDNNLSVSPNPIRVGPAYTATVETDVTIATAGTAIPLHGTATQVAGGPAAFVPVNIHVRVLGMERVLQATTIADGTFSATFQPLLREAGLYEIEATHPAVSSGTVQDTFTLVGMSLSPSSMSERLVVLSTNFYEFTLQNLSDVPLTGITAALEDVPPNIDFRVEMPNALAGSSNAIVRCRIQAADDSVATGVMRLILQAAEGARAEMLFAFRVVHPRTELVANPGFLQASMLRGQRSFVRFEVLNTGAVASGDLDILLPGTSWLSLVSAQHLASLAPGEKAEVELALLPPLDMALGASTGALVISGAGGATSVPFQFNTVSDLHGALLVSTTDEFTYNAPGSPMLTNAVVTLTDARTLEEVATGKTGPNGELLLTNLVEAYYNLVVRAERHSEFRATFLLAGGQTNVVNAFLQGQFVTYSWNVVPIEIEDRYEFQLQTTYETHVPAPVVVVEPAMVDLATVSGDATQVNFTLANHGLIAAKDLKFTPPVHPEWEIVPLVTDLGELAAMSSMQLPVTFRRVRPGGAGVPAGSPTQAVPKSPKDAKGAAGGDCTASISAEYWYPCGKERPWLKVLVPVINFSPGCHTNFPSLPREPREGYVLPQVSARNFELPPYIPELYVQPVANVAESIFAVLTGVQSLFCSECGSALAACALQWVPWPAAYECVDNSVQAYEAAGESPESALKKAEFVKQAAMAYLKCKAMQAAEEAAEAIAKRILQLQVLECIKLAYQHCWHSTPEKPTPYPGRQEKDKDETGDESPEAALFLEHLGRGNAELDALTEPYGNAAWLRYTDGAAFGNWFEAFEQAAATNSVEASAISASERATLLALPLPAPVDAAIATAFIERWNRSVDYWSRGWLYSTNVPAGQDTNFLALDSLISKLNAGLEAKRKSEADGFLDVLDGLIYAKDLYLMKLTENEAGVCAKVRLRLNQSAVVTRSAFEGTLELNNNSGAPLQNLRVTLEIRGPTGARADDLFGTRNPRLDGITGVDGAGTLAAGASGRAIWVFIPTRDAAPLEPQQYTIGGQVTFTQGGQQTTLPLYPVPIQVHPDPLLVVKYFYERDVYADDPFTAEIEPSEPFALAMMMANTGRGTARNVTVTSAQPQIVDNEKGLLIDFNLIGSQVGGQDISPALRVTLGDIPPGHAAIATWWMTTSLQGQFSDYTASFSHIDALGDKKLSLIDSVETHDLTHLVRVDVPADDGQRDFLVNDRPDILRRPDTLHLSQGGTLPVALFENPTVDGAPTNSDLIIQLTATAPIGWGYLRMPDPATADYRLVSVTRSDARALRLGDNVWRTRRTVRKEGEPPTEERWLHLFDFGGPGVYTLTYEAPAPTDLTPPSSAVEALPANSRKMIPVQWSGLDAGGSGLASYDVFVSVNGGPWVPWLERTAILGAIYQGSLGNRYAFYSVATDTSGNRESAPASPDATTVVSLQNLAPTLDAIPDQAVEEEATLTLKVSASDADGPAGTLIYSLTADAPPNATIDPATGDLTWTPSETDGGSAPTLTVRVQDSGDADAAATRSFRITVREVNRAPLVAALPDQNITLGQTLSFIIPASDADIPANTLSFALLAGAPTNAALSPTTGLFTWTPAAAQGESTHRVTVVVTDNGLPPLHATNSFMLFARLPNTPPVLIVPGAQTVDELTPWVVPLSVTDAESSAGPFVFDLLAAPAGATVDRSSGLLSWTPTEADGPGTNALIIRVTDDGWPPLSHTGTVQVVVREVNAAPQLAALSDWIVKEGETLRFTAAASDADLPVNTLTYSLAAGVPEGAALDPTTGEFVWRPREFQGGTTNTITIRVADDASPALTATQPMTIVVEDTQPDFRLGVGSTNLLVGQTGSVPLWLASGAGLESLTCELELPTNLLANCHLTSTAPALATASLTPVGGNRFLLSFASAAGTSVSGTQQLSRLAFTVPAGLSSARAALSLSMPHASVEGGRLLHGLSANGGVVLVGEEPLVEARLAAPQQPQLAIYAPLGAEVTVERLVGNLQSASWSPHLQITATNLPTIVPLTFNSSDAVFYRAARKTSP